LKKSLKKLAKYLSKENLPAILSEATNRGCKTFTPPLAGYSKIIVASLLNFWYAR